MFQWRNSIIFHCWLLLHLYPSETSHERTSQPLPKDASPASSSIWGDAPYHYFAYSSIWCDKKRPTLNHSKWASSTRGRMRSDSWCLVQTVLWHMESCEMWLMTHLKQRQLGVKSYIFCIEQCVRLQAC